MNLEQYGYTENHLFQAKNNYIHRKVADVDVLISIGENIANFNGYIEMNQSAALIWDALKEKQTIQDLTLLIINTFKINESQAQKDVLDFLKMLEVHQMVMISEDNVNE